MSAPPMAASFASAKEPTNVVCGAAVGCPDHEPNELSPCGTLPPAPVSGTQTLGHRCLGRLHPGLDAFPQLGSVLMTMHRHSVLRGSVENFVHRICGDGDRAIRIAGHLAAVDLTLPMELIFFRLRMERWNARPSRANARGEIPEATVVHKPITTFQWPPTISGLRRPLTPVKRSRCVRSQADERCLRGPRFTQRSPGCVSARCHPTHGAEGLRPSQWRRSAPTKLAADLAVHMTKARTGISAGQGPSWW